jgi:hypothetical protein
MVTDRDNIICSCDELGDLHALGDHDIQAASLRRYEKPTDQPPEQEALAEALRRITTEYRTEIVDNEPTDDGLDWMPSLVPVGTFAERILAALAERGYRLVSVRKEVAPPVVLEPSMPEAATEENAMAMARRYGLLDWEEKP